MGPVSAEVEIDVPRELAFEAIADLARRPSFTDHFLADFHLTRLDSSGVGAGARFRVALAPRQAWMDTAIVELDQPHKLVERGRGGRANRIPATTVWELVAGSGSLTRVRVAHWTEPKPLDRLLEVLSGAAFRQERAWREALRRLRDLLEGDAAPPPGVAVAGGNAHLTGVP
ncbi:MAG TPA: SRPBCC family protein [Solirubrobacterales bacterium]|nr:SRPBCC family protein [Solirubrobacterales bacterium]